ncbi:MAG TPA: T9SS type A sorting domain-containing protein, partial [Ferruginibacter sp.]|nr:T9SS type A sorting domain-containing protein [Ferruginibacter sp.]
GATAVLGGSSMLTINTGKNINIATTANVIVPADSSVTIIKSLPAASISKAGTANFIVNGLADMTDINMSNTGGAVTINGTLRTAATDGLRGSAASTVTNGTVTVNHGSMVEYYAAGNQNVTGSGVLGGGTYHAIKFSGSGTKTLTNLANVHDSVIITGTPIVDAMSFNLGSTVGETFRMDGGRLRLGTVTTPGPLMNGAYNLTGGVVEFASNAATRQTIRGTQTNAYYNVEVTGTNVGQSSGNINIKHGGTFTIKTNAILHMNDVAIVDSTGTTTQSFVMEAGSKLFTANILGFNGPVVGFNTPTVKSDIENISLAAGSTIDYNRSNFYLGLANGNQVVTTTLPYQNLIFSGDGNKTPAAGTTITVEGNLTKGGRPTANFVHNDGTVELNSTVAQTYTDSAFTKIPIELNNLTLKNNTTVTLKNSMGVNQKMLFDNTTPNTVLVLDSGNIHLRSRADTTAWVAAIPSTVFINYDNGGTNQERGRFVVERYNFNGRKWRFYSIPDTTLQTINQAWQEGATSISQNPVPGYGTLIGSYYSNWNTPARQWFDMYTVGGHDMKWWSNDASQRYNTIGKTDTAIATNTGWMKFVRGDRTITAGSSISLLRTKGKIKRNAQSVTFTATAANQYFSVGNPYPSSIDMRIISKSGFVAGPGARVQQFLVWDPRLGGAYGLGAFQAFTYDGTNYRVTPGGGSYGANNSVDNVIENGAAFFVQSSGIGAGTVSFTEAAKVDGSREVFRINGLDEKLSVIMETNAPGETPEVLDGIMAMFDDSYTNEINGEDLMKFSNPGENIAINKGNDKLLMIESHPSIVADDTLFLKISGMKAKPYRLNVQVENMAKPGLMAWLVDKFTETSTPIDLLTGLIYNFDITTNPSAVPDRFMIVFKNATVVPVKIVSIAAERNNNGSNSIKWRVENETGVAHYELQRSHNGSTFTALQTNIAATDNNGGSALYSRIDNNPLVADNYYRVKATLQNGRVEYSAIVKLSTVKAPSSITVFPNPVKENRFNIEFVNQPEGRYVLDLLAANGQVVYSFAVMVAGNNFVKTVTPARVIAGGTYHIRLTAPDGKTTVKKIMVE